MAHLLLSRVQKLVNIISSLLLFWVLSGSGYAQTSLSPGDILVVSINTTNSTVEIVPLVDIDENTVLSLKVGSDPDVTLEAKLNLSVRAGNSILLATESSDQLGMVGELKLNTESDQITILQKESENSRILFNASWGDNDQTSMVGIGTTIPFIKLGKGSNHQYYLKNGASGTEKMIRNMITDPANWKSSDKPFSQLGTSFRILSAPVVVFNQNLSTVSEGDSIPLNVAIYEHDGSRLTVDVILNEAFSTADTNDINSFRSYTYNFTGLIGDAVYEIAIPQYDDGIFEDRETVFFELQNLSAGNFGDFVSHAAFIMDNEIPDVTITSVFDSDRPNEDYIELFNNERVYVNINGWELKIDDDVYILKDLIELAPFEQRRINAHDIKTSSDEETELEFDATLIQLTDGSGNNISELNIKREIKAETEITESKKEEITLEFESPQNVVELIQSDLKQKTEKEEATSENTGWFPVSSFTETSDSETIFWDERLSRFRAVSSIETDSLLGISFFQYVTPYTETSQFESNYEDSLMTETNFQTEFDRFITISATDLDENGIINGAEGYNFVRFQGQDSISVVHFIQQIEREIGDNFIHPMVFTVTDSASFQPLDESDFIYDNDFIWVKADSIIEKVEISFENDLPLITHELPEIIDEPISNFAISANSPTGSTSIGFNFYDIESEIPLSILHPVFDLGFKISNTKKPQFATFNYDHWRSEINLTYQQEILLAYPIGLLNSESTEISLQLEEWNMEGGWRLFIEDLETNERTELFPGESFDIEYIVDSNDESEESEVDSRLRRNSIYQQYQLLIASPEFVEDYEESPEQIELNQNFPNPFNPATTISFYLPEALEVRLSVFNVVGQPIAVLEEGVVSPGEHHYEWNASGYPSGMYIYQLEVGNKVMTRKMTLVK